MSEAVLWMNLNTKYGIEVSQANNNITDPEMFGVWYESKVREIRYARVKNLVTALGDPETLSEAATFEQLVNVVEALDKAIYDNVSAQDVTDYIESQEKQKALGWDDVA